MSNFNVKDPRPEGVPENGPVELWFVDLAASAAALDASEAKCARLSANELQRIAASVTPAAGFQRRAAYIALRVLIERMWGPSWRAVPYSLTGSGKPILPGISGGFSLAHVDRFALIGLSRTSLIGVDLEPDRRPTVSDERRVRIEHAALELAGGIPLPDARQKRFLQAWVRLEAIAKADGRGIGRLLTGLGIIGNAAMNARELNQDYARAINSSFGVHDVAVPEGCVAAAALDCGIMPPAVVKSLPTKVADLETLMGVPAGKPVPPKAG